MPDYTQGYAKNQNPGIEPGFRTLMLSEDLSTARALIVEGNPPMRAMLVSQMREFGVRSVVQCGRLVDARRHLEYQTFDFVLCELHFKDENASGQDLLDDLRRNQLLPFSTVFVMITGEATYSSVAEAAESALDGYLLKPHKPSQLNERLQQARQRKVALQDIFVAIEENNFERAAKLCLDRFARKAPYWLYAARIGAELLLRLDRPGQAQKLYETVIQAKTLPWAKLGVARSMLDGGQVAAAISTLGNLIAGDPTFADAYDVMGRAQFEQGRFDAALATYQMAAQLTPASIGRVQNVGIMAFYADDREVAESALHRTCLLGLDSKMFDCQCLVLMAFMYFERGDHKSLQRCAHDFERVIERNPDLARPRRLSLTVDVLNLLQHHRIAQALTVVRAMMGTIGTPEFDFESASNLVGVLAQLAKHTIRIDEVHAVMDKLALRFCSSRSACEILASAASAHPPYADQVREGNAKVIKYAEYALSLSLAGDARGAANELIRRGNETLNTKLLESAEMVVNRYSEKMGDVTDMQQHLRDLRSLCMVDPATLPSGDGPRKAGALSLRVGGAAARKKAELTDN